MIDTPKEWMGKLMGDPGLAWAHAGDPDFFSNLNDDPAAGDVRSADLKKAERSVRAKSFYCNGITIVHPLWRSYGHELEPRSAELMIALNQIARDAKMPGDMQSIYTLSNPGYIGAFFMRQQIPSFFDVFYGGESVSANWE